MRTSFGLLVALFLLAAWAMPAQAHAQATPTQEQAVRRASLGWLDAYNRRDMASFAAYIDKDYVGTTDDGILTNRNRLIAWLTPKPPAYTQRTDLHDMTVHIDGDVAIVNYLVTNRHGWDSTMVVNYLRRTEILRKKSGKWLVIASHESLIPKNFFTALPTDPQQLIDYVGTYDWPRHEASDRDTYTVENGRLISEWRGERKECLRMGPDTFFSRDDSGWWTFTRDQTGHVTGYVYYYPDGQAIPVRRIE